MSTPVLASDPPGSAAKDAPSRDGAPQDPGFDGYRSLHTGAVVGVVASIVSLFFPFVVSSAASLTAALPLAGLPIVSLAVGVWAWSAIRNNREYFTGEKLAAIATLVSAVSLFGGVGYGGYVYATEVPAGYTRTSFLAMKPTDEDIRSQTPIPPAIQQLKGAKIFIKGFMRPDSTKSRVNIKEFLLVRDSNQCCFGDLSQVAFFDQIQIELTGGLTTDLFPRVYRVGGKLDWRRGRKAGEPPLVYFIKADYIK